MQQPALSLMNWFIDSDVTVQKKSMKTIRYSGKENLEKWIKLWAHISNSSWPIVWPSSRLCLPSPIKNMNHSFRLWLLTSSPVGLCKQPSRARHWLNSQACGEKEDVWRWQMVRCWRWVAARLPVPQFTWRFIKHFGQGLLERPHCGVIWSPASGIL